MRGLIDTQAVLWAAEDPSKLSPAAASIIQNPANDLFISAATIWEVSIKVGLGKLRISGPYRQWMDRALADLAAKVLPITVAYADAQASLPLHHRDPFDRLLIAQAISEGIPIVGADIQFDAYGVHRIW